MDTKDIAPPQSDERIPAHVSSGMKSFQDHLKILLLEDTSSFYAHFKKTKLKLFEQEKSSPITKEVVVKEDYKLCTKLFISCQNRECELKEFFHHENQAFSAPLSN